MHEQMTAQGLKKKTGTRFKLRKQSKSPVEELKPMKKRNIVPKIKPERYSDEDEDAPIPKMAVGIKIEKPPRGQEYLPFGKMNESPYPQRLRVPPLRYWLNEKRNYNRGMLESITLVDDKRGNTVAEIVEAQLN